MSARTPLRRAGPADHGGAIMIARILAVILLMGALIAGGIEAVRSASAGSYELFSFGEAWYLVHSESLNMLQAGVQRHVAPWIWDLILLPILTLPLWVVLAVPALLLLWMAKPRTRSHFFPRHRRH